MLGCSSIVILLAFGAANLFVTLVPAECRGVKSVLISALMPCIGFIESILVLSNVVMSWMNWSALYYSARSMWSVENSAKTIFTWFSLKRDTRFRNFLIICVSWTSHLLFGQIENSSKNSLQHCCFWEVCLWTELYCSIEASFVAAWFFLSRAVRIFYTIWFFPRDAIQYFFFSKRSKALQEQKKSISIINFFRNDGCHVLYIS